MDTVPIESEEISESARGIKRKRSPSKCTSVGSTEDAASTSYAQATNKTQVMKCANRKRKFVFTNDITAPIKRGRFYYLNKLMIKPRRSKVDKSQPVEETPSEETLVTGRSYTKLHFARLDSCGNAVLMHRLYLKSDLFFNDEKQCNYENFKKVDLSFHVVDEVALEGLDGITLEAFWKRFRLVFSNNISKSVADRIWRMICNNKRINFYVLNEPREELTFFNYCRYLDVDSGMFVEPFLEFKDIYPLSSVNGSEVRGSCCTFKTRKENNGVRKFSVEKALKLYDRRLVFVADQAVRNKAIINDEADPNIELLDVEYCLLEKIGRSRLQGEFTQGKMSIINDNKRLYHNRKALMQYSLTVNQTFCLKSLPTQQNITGGLIHLTRFYHKRTPVHMMIMERIANLLRSKPNNQVEFPEFRKIFGRNVAVIKLLKMPEFRKYFKTYMFPYRKLYPNASRHEYLHKNKQKERQIRVIRMVDPCANVTAAAESKDNTEVPQTTSSAGESSGYKLMNYEYLRDIFLYILSTGPVGVTLKEIHDYFKMDFYAARMALRKLLLRNVIGSSRIDLGRQQSLKFFAKCYANTKCEPKTATKEFKLSDETLATVLGPYRNITLDPEPELALVTKSAPPPSVVEVKLNFTPFCCSAFFTETVDSTSEEQTIYEIVNKGRDRILLIQSNLFAHYISEWEDFLLKRDEFTKSIRLFVDGYGKIICDFLTTMKMADCEALEPDNKIIFKPEDVSLDTRVGRLVQGQRILKIKKNYTSPHSDCNYRDPVAKIYQLEATLNESHPGNNTLNRLRSVFERFMLACGKRKREADVCVKQEPQIEVQMSNEIVMEKFMGPNPYLVSSSDDESIKIRIYSSTKVPFVKNGSVYRSKDVSLTQRHISRANIILKSIHEKHVVKDVRTLFVTVRKQETDEGYDKKVCNKSVVSILSKLVQEGYVKVYKVVMTGNNTVRNLCFFCTPFVGHESNLIQSIVEQFKMKFYVGAAPTPKTVTVKKKVESSPFCSSDVKESIVELKQLTSVKMEPDCKVDKAAGRLYGYAPKFVRLRVLHEHLFCVIREMTEREALSDRQVFEMCKSVKLKLSNEDMAELPPIYRSEVGWKMFISALPQHTGWPKGWVLACDVILRMPLSVFVKLHNVPYDIPDLDTYLKHPIKQHYLLKHLPVHVRNVLLHKRKYFHSIYDSLCYLCYMGLLQLGPRNFKEKDQMFIFLNMKATLYDTCSSSPGYNKIEDKSYKKTLFEFKSYSDVEIYWSELLRICMNTLLGKRKVVDGQCVTIEECSSKPAMVDTLKAKTFEQALKDDIGRLPGDRRGAAGLDSSLWSYVKKNWLWGPNEPKPSVSNEVKMEKKESVLPQPIRNDLLAKNGPGDVKVYLKPATRKTNIKSVVSKMSSRKKFVRRIVAKRSTRVRREHYDSVDVTIMKKNSSSRVDWDEDEDQLLRYSRIASVFLCPEYKKQFIPYNIVRDVLHRLCPKTKNKTARAIQRRIYVLQTHDEAIRVMENNIDNLLNSDAISKHFEQIHKRYRYNTKISDAQAYIAFVYLMFYIYKHRKEIELLLLGHFATFDFFSETNIAEFESIVQEEATGAAIYTDPKTVEDVTRDTIRSVVHCSMACKRNTIGWTFHLSRIYKKFNDEVLRSTVQEMKKQQFFVVNKNQESKSLNDVWGMPLKFSHLYNTMKSATYAAEMFLEAYRHFVECTYGQSFWSFLTCNEMYTFWEKVDLEFDVPEMGIILNPGMDNHDEVIDELAKRFRFYLVKIHEKKTEPEKSEEKVRLVETEEEPERNLEAIKGDVRHLIFRVPYLLEGNLESYFKNMLESGTDVEVNNYVFLMIVELKNFVQTCSPTDALGAFLAGIDDESIGEHSQLLKNLSRVVFAIRNIQQEENRQSTDLENDFKTWESEIWDELRTVRKEARREIRLGKTQAGGMESCVIRAKAGDFPTIEEIKHGMMADVVDGDNREIPHITDLIMLLTEGRFPELDNDNETVEKMKEHFVVQYPKLQHFLIEDLDEMVGSPAAKQILDQSRLTVVKEVSEKYLVHQPQLDSIVSHIKGLEGGDSDVKATEILIDFIKERKELGVGASELKARFVNEFAIDFVQLLHFLCDIGVLLRTGVASFVYVHHDYQSEWITETFALTTREKEVFEANKQQTNLRLLIGENLESKVPRRVQLKPWTKLDGSVNNELLLEWLSRVLSRCLDLPNVPLLTLCDTFHYIKPVDVYALLEVLQELGCVQLCVFKMMTNSILSERLSIDECAATCLDSFNDVFVKTTNIAGLCFGGLGML